MTSPSAAKLRPAPTSATTLPLASLAMLLLPLTALGAWSWWGATRVPRPRDAAPPIMLALGAGASLPPLRRSPARGAGHPEGTRRRAASAPPAEKPLVLGPARPVVTSSADGLLRRVFSPPALVLLALDIVVAALLRTMVAPLATGVLLVVPLLIAAAFPAVRKGFQAHSLALIGDDGLLEAGAPLVGWVTMCALVTVMIGMLAGLALSVAVVFPGMAVLFPQEVVGENDLSTRPEDLRRNIAAVRALSLLVILIFVFSWLIVDARVGEGRFWLAMATLAVMVVLTILIVRWQQRTPTSEIEDAPGTSPSAEVSAEGGIGTNGPDLADPPTTPKQW